MRHQASYETLAFLVIEALLIVLSSIVLLQYVYPYYDANFSRLNDDVQRLVSFWINH